MTISANALILVSAVRTWWKGRRPLSWSEAEHSANPTVNCTSDAERQLAEALRAFDSDTQAPAAFRIVGPKGKSEWQDATLVEDGKTLLDVTIEECAKLDNAADISFEFAYPEKETKHIPDLSVQHNGGWIEIAKRIAAEIIPLLPMEAIADPEGRSETHLTYLAERLALGNVGSETKTCRWLGYLQAGLILKRLSTLSIEKDRNRKHAGAVKIEVESSARALLPCIIAGLNDIVSLETSEPTMVYAIAMNLLAHIDEWNRRHTDTVTEKAVGVEWLGDPSRKPQRY